MTMHIDLAIRNDASQKRLYRRDALERIARAVCEGEGVAEDEVEISLYFCDDETIRSLNKNYRKKDSATDVLSFSQDAPGEGPRVLGDIVISLDTVECRFPGDAAAMRGEVRVLFCHALLHLLGYDHDSEANRRRMAEKQAKYLGLPIESAWPTPV